MIESSKTAWAADRAREMLAAGINIQATGPATNNLITAILTNLLAHIDELTADLKCAIAVGQMAARASDGRPGQVNDIATIERALKDADLIIEKLNREPALTGQYEIKMTRERITEALMLLRQIPGQHSPTTATRQAIVALQNALRHYAELGPEKMERRDLDLIRDAALYGTGEATREPTTETTTFDIASCEWAAQRWRDEVANRPLQNKHRRTLDDTWRQVIRHFGGDDIALCGPRHDDLVR